MEESVPPQTQPGVFGSSPASSPHKKRKKVLLIVSTVVIILIIAGAGLSYWAIQNRDQQLAAQAKLEAKAKAKADAEAKARQGTVSDLQMRLDVELNETKKQNDRTIYSVSDSLKREAEAAITVGSGNESGL